MYKLYISKYVTKLISVFFSGSVDNKTLVRRGKGIGGTSLINGMTCSRGDKIDFQIWSNLLDDDEWSYEKLLPYFKKSENFTRTNPYAPIDFHYHGYDGLLHTTQNLPLQKISGIYVHTWFMSHQANNTILKKSYPLD